MINECVRNSIYCRVCATSLSAAQLLNEPSHVRLTMLTSCFCKSVCVFVALDFPVSRDLDKGDFILSTIYALGNCDDAGPHLPRHAAKKVRMINEH
jgi:hypothetical protein